MTAPTSTMPTPATSSSSASTTKVVRLALLTESRAQTARRCLREEKLRYVEGLTSRKTPEGMRFGTLGHHALETWWKCWAHRLEAAGMAIRSNATPDSDAYEVAKLEALIEGYDARWGSSERYTVLGVEREFRAPLINPETGARSRTFERAGKLDVLVTDAEGRGLVVEHKFSGEDIGPGSTFWARLRIGGQSAGYIRGAEALGVRVDGVLYDVLARPRLEPLKATPPELRKYTKATKTEPSRLYANQRDRDETVDEYRDRVRADIAEHPDKYYQRGLVVRLDAELDEHDRELWLLSQTLREHHRLQLAPRNTDACHRYGSMCSYFPLCCGEASVDDYARAEWVHPELQQPKEEA